MSTRIKFCGITRPQDARLAVDLGIEAIGLVFTRRSQRFIGISQAREIRRMLSAVAPLARMLRKVSIRERS